VTDAARPPPSSGDAAADGPAAVNGSDGVAMNGGAPGDADAGGRGADNAHLPLYGGVTWQPDGQAVYGFPRPSPGSQPPGNPLATRIGRAIGWIFMDAASARFGTLLIGLVLARLMGPAELGVFGIAVVVLLAAHSIGQFGMGTALAVWRNAPERMAGTATTVALTTSAAVYAACYLGAPALAGALGVPAATSVIRVMALSVVVSALVTAPRAMVQRRAPRTRVLIEQADNWLGIAITVGLAATGHGLMSFAIGRLAGSGVSALLFIISSPAAFRIGYRRKGGGALIRSALPFGASAAFAFAITNADQAVVGVLLHTTSLGYYVLALCLASWPITMFSQQVRDAAPVAFARFRRGPQVMGSAFLSSANLLAAVTLPVCVLLAVLAGPIVQLIYGPAWAPAAPVLAWLAPLATLRVFYALANEYFAVLAPTRRRLGFQLIWLVCLVPALVAGARWHGILGVAMAEVAVALLFLVPWYLAEVRPRVIWPPLLARRSAFPLTVAACVGLIAAGVHRLAPSGRLDLAIGAAAAAAAMALLLFRLRTVFVAMRQATASSARRPGRVADVLGPALAVTIEPPIYPVYAQLPHGLQPAAERALGSKIAAGARWSALNTAIVRVCNFLVGAILARTVFGPSAWGLYAVSQIVLAVLLSANELGVTGAIIRWDGNVRSFARTVFTLSVMSSTCIYVVLYVTAPAVARLLGSPDATGMLRLLCICVIIDGLAAVPLSLITREFAQGKRMLADIVNFVVTTSVTLWLAFSGHGVISFAWGSLVGNTVSFIILFVAAPYVVLPGWNTKDARQLLQFGLPLAGAGLLTLAVVNVDSAIVGATLGPAMLGLYQLAFNISSWPVNSISQAVERISFAGFSRVANSVKALSSAFTRSIGLLMAITVPACVLLATLAQPLIHAIYGERWVPAAHALTFLAILGLMRVAYVLMNDCLAATPKRSTLMGVQALWLTALVPVLFIGARWRGITGVSIGHVAVAALLVGPAFLWTMSSAGIKVRSIFTACLRPFLGGALMAVVSLAVIHYLGEGLTGLAAAIVAALAVYAPIVYPMRKLARKAPPDDAGTPAKPDGPDKSPGQGRHRRPDAPERQPRDQDWGHEVDGETARLPTSG
jgi:O-antigen/teichoic acid export membrane protein